jgi:hypothetical protein
MRKNHEAERVDISFFLSNDDKFSPNNGAILTIATIIKAVMSSAAEAELGALYINSKEAVYLRQILNEMNHPQPRMPMQTDNTTAEGVINKKYNRNVPKQWTCDSIGFATAKHKANLKFIGGRGRGIWRMILQSIMPPHTM